jgi:hypothetical protein
MALYDRDYNNSAVDTNYATTTDNASVTFMKQTYQLLGASMIASALGAYVAMPYVEIISSFKWFILDLLCLWSFLVFYD